eukprot:1853453-Amphidinium_carterae.1
MTSIPNTLTLTTTASRTTTTTNNHNHFSRAFGFEAVLFGGFGGGLCWMHSGVYNRFWGVRRPQKGGMSSRPRVRTACPSP